MQRNDFSPRINIQKSFLLFAGRSKSPRGPHLARGPHFAQVCKRFRSEHAEESNVTALQRYRKKGRAKKYFGTEGNDVGQMSHPDGISSTAADDIVVVDAGNHRIQIFDVNGKVKGVFGGRGASVGQFDYMHDVCVTPRGRIVASDFGNHRIQIFDEYWNFVQKFGRNGELNRPHGVATDDNGLIYVCDSSNQVQVFSKNGKFVRKFGSKSLISPEYLSVTSYGRVVVSDRYNNVHVFDWYGSHLFQFGTGGTNDFDESQFRNPSGIATDQYGNIIVCDFGNHRVQVFSSDGEFASCFGSKGSDPGQMKKPVGVCLLSDGGIAVSEYGNHRVQIF